MAKTEIIAQEHAEPGTGTPPIPAYGDDTETDKAIKGGWRRDSPPASFIPPPPP